MTENKHNVKIKKEIVSKGNQDVMTLVYKKMQFFDDVIQKTIVNVQKNKVFDLLGIVEVNTCVERIMAINKQINSISESTYKNPPPDELINYLQNINNELSSLLKIYGTESLEDLLLICFGNNNRFTETDDEIHKFDILKKYFHPTGYKIVSKKDDSKLKKGNDETIDENTKNLDCFDILSSYKQFHMRVYGLKVYIYNSTLKKGLIVYGIIDDVIVDLLNSPYITRHKKDIKEE